MKKYIPQPIDTSDVVMSEEINALATLLARNTHDVWAVGRLAEGWSYGRQRSDELKQTPCMVDYDELTPQEQAYDYNTAVETIKVMLKLGFRILPPEK